MIGKVLKERYKIIKKLGKGGMAIVYEAKDLLLDRKVALKMLRSEFVDDKDFIKKFRHEAKAVARLSHPNIVNIFDIGQDEELHYLVMEYIQGENLKSIIKKRGKLTVLESLDIANQICAALVIAHKNNIIHCDIKPHNIILTPDKQVKVTDFGIARAATSSTVTMTMTDTIVGSAHYFSPEQARGGEIKTRSDLYSLGIVLYEMLTGEVPFQGDSPISVALKHIQESPKKPSVLNPDIPHEVDRLVMKAIAKEPDERFKNAAEMRESITAVIKELSTGENKEKSRNYSYSDDGDTKILKKVKPDENQGNVEADETREIVRNGDNTQKTERDYLTAPTTRKREIPTWLVWTAGIFFLFLVTLGGFYFFYQNYMEVPVVKVPDLVGMELEEAEKVASQVGLQIVMENEGVNHSQVPEGHIISQYPAAGEMIRQTRVITVTISKGPAKVVMPELVNMTLREAQIILDNQNLTVGEEEYVYDNDVPEGTIIEQKPEPGQEIASDTRINLVISRGPQPNMVDMPNVIGLSREEALARIENSNLTLGEVKEEKTRRFRAGQVAKQEYPAGTRLPEDSKVNLTISSGIINPNNAEIHTVRVSFFVPAGPREQRIKIVVVDDNGSDEVYNNIHNPGEEIILRINSVGYTEYKFYINNELYDTYNSDQLQR